MFDFDFMWTAMGLISFPHCRVRTEEVRDTCGRGGKRRYCDRAGASTMFWKLCLRLPLQEIAACAEAREKEGWS